MNVEIVYSEPHPKQKEIFDTAKRFNHIQCGRRFGKTELILELTEPILDGYPVGVFCPIERDFIKTWEAIVNLYRPLIRRKNETYHTLELITKGEIHMWSMKAVDNGRGERYKRVILDEFAKTQHGKKSFEETIRATLTDYKGDCWIFSTPKGRRNYFYKLKEMHKNNPNWSFHKYTSYDNPYLDPEEIEDAKSTLDKISFAQEYLAEDVDKNELPFLYSYDETKHLTTGLKIDDRLPLWLSFDFNVLPQTCIIAQRVDHKTVHIIDLIRLNNASIYDMCDHIKVKFPYYYMVTGDASGRNRSGMNNLSYWAIIQQELSLKDMQIHVRRANLDHRSSQVVCNSILEHKNILINTNLSELTEDLEYASTDENGKIIKTPERGMHFFDGFRYLLDASFPDILKMKI